MSWGYISVAFVMGFAGSLHCAGMCGPILWMMPFQGTNGLRRYLGIALYHLARITVYALMAMMLYSFKSLFHPQWQQYVSIVLGVLLLVAGFSSYLPKFKVNISLPWAGFVSRHLGKFMKQPGLTGLFFAGALNGMLPCGLEYMAMSSTLVAPSHASAAIMMYAFGLGTMPMLVAVTILRNKISFARYTAFKKAIPLVVLAFGILFVVRGMNLGIPYLSPKVVVKQQEVKMSCCQKK